VSNQLRSAWGHRPLHRLLAAAAITLLACSADTEPTIPGSPVELSIFPAGLTLIVGAEGSLTAQATDAKGRLTSAAFVWSSASPSVATVGANNGIVTAIAPGTTTVTATTASLRATVTVTVRPSDPVAVVISPTELSLKPGGVERLTARAYDATGRQTSVPFEWSTADPAVATVGTTDGIVTAVSVGETTVTAAVGALRATATVTVEPDSLYAQWATGATASTQYTTSEWSALQATGAPNAVGCNDDPRAWATLEADGVDWLELTYDQPVRPTEIRIHEVWGVGSIVKVEVKDLAGEYHTVYTAQPTGVQFCPRTLTIAVKGVTEMVSTVRVSLDQRVIFDWNEIDAVRLAGYR
jgi:Big-like domain-containing protein